MMANRREASRLKDVVAHAGLRRKMKNNVSAILKYFF